MNVKTTLNKVKFGVQKKSPEILLVTGILTGVAAVIVACKETTRAEAILDAHKERMDKVHETRNLYPDEYSEKSAKLETVKNYGVTALELTKLYAPAIALEMVSITSILASYKILHARNVAMASAYAVVDKAFKQYRERVRKELGAAADEKFLTGAEEVTVSKKVTDENGKTKTVKEKVLTNRQASGYSKFFDCSNVNWIDDPDSNLFFVTRIEQWANDKLKANGYLYLNSVYEMLGLEKTKAGQVVGWIYDGKSDIGDNYIDFGIEHGNSDACKRFTQGLEENILLSFNVDGPITDRLVEEEHAMTEI